MLAKIRFWTWAHRATAVVFLALLVATWRGNGTWLRGSATATHLARLIPFVDPLAALETLGAARHATVTMLIGVAITGTIALVLGRVFCGWFCPLGLALELFGALRRRIERFLKRWHVNVPRFRPATDWKYGLLAATLLLSAVFSVPVFTAVSPINWFVLGLYEFHRIAVVGFLLLLVLEAIAPRVFCRSICPLGALYALLGTWAPLRIRIRPDGPQLMCRQCSMHCPMEIPVMEDYVLQDRAAVDDPECTRCGACTDVCRAGVITLGFGRRVATANDPPCPDLVSLPESEAVRHDP